MWSIRMVDHPPAHRATLPLDGPDPRRPVMIIRALSRLFVGPATGQVSGGRVPAASFPSLPPLPLYPRVLKHLVHFSPLIGQQVRG